MLTRLLVNPLLVNIAYMKIWVHLTFVLVHLRKKVSLEPWEAMTDKGQWGAFGQDTSRTLYEKCHGIFNDHK